MLGRMEEKKRKRKTKICFYVYAYLGRKTEGNSPKRVNRKRERERENLSQEEYNRDEKLCYYVDATCLAEESWSVKRIGRCKNKHRKNTKRNDEIKGLLFFTFAKESF
jgi:hypothetical protein